MGTTRTGRRNKGLQDSSGYRGTRRVWACILLILTCLGASSLAALGFRSLWATRGLRASPFSEGLRDFISDILLPKRGPPRRRSTYVALHDVVVFVFSSTRRRACTRSRMSVCVHAHVRRVVAQWRFNVVPWPFKQAGEISRRIPRATRVQRSGDLIPPFYTLSSSRIFSFLFFPFTFISLAAPFRPAPSSSINHPFSILPATSSLRGTNIARTDQRLDLIWLVLHWELRGCTYARFVSVNSHRSSRWR